MKKAASLVMAAAMAATCVSALPEMPVKAAQVNFTHEEWTGKNGAEDIFAVNREAASVDPVPFQDAASAAAAVWEYNERENSDYLQMLTGSGGDWDLRVVQNAEQAQGVFMSGFANADFYPNPADGWRSVSLPNSWTAQGFDFPIYDNVIMPWQSNYDGYVPCPTAPTKYNPVGLYRKKFTPDSSMLSSGRRVYIQFDGVESAYYVYLNGKAVGYSEDTFSPHRFDITDYLTEGENTLAVEVHKFCDGTWFEGQDMIYDGGIFRDVFLVSAPEVQIRDYTVRTDLNDSFTAAELTVDAEIANFSGSDKSGWSVTADAYDETGELLFSGASAEIGNVSRGGKTAVKISANVDSPKLWSAEHPNIYALILTLRDSFGNEQEVLSTQLGFREIGFTPTQVDSNYKVTTTSWQPMTINGKRLLLKGVNRHDTDPFHGKAVPQETMREDIFLMQKNNVNAIRTSHYSNDSYLYWLCNKYGMYVMGETNMESHALMNDNDNKARFYELAMDRTETAYKRLKNNPSIVAWSIGNEMAYTSDPNAAGGMFRDMIWYFKKNDPTRPVHSEGQGNTMGVDMGSNMYPASQWLGGNGGNGKIPYVMCEYDHAMGNSLGALKEYWDVVRAHQNMLGGFIWDWVDQSRAVPLDKVGGGWDYYSEPYARKNLYAEESRGKFFAYGGDWGDKPNDNSFCENGIISPDRTEQPEAAEVRYQYQSFWFSASAEQLSKNQISVFNENDFTDLDEFDLNWSLLKNGISIQSGTVEGASAAPLAKADITVPFKLPEKRLAGDEFILDLSVVKRSDERMIPAGTEVAYEQIPISSSGRAVSNAAEGSVEIADSSDCYNVKGSDFSFRIEKSTGLMTKYTYKGEQLIDKGPDLNFWRGNVENDGGNAREKIFDKAWEKAAEKISVDGIDVKEGADGGKTVVSHLTLPDAGNTKVDIQYDIAADGRVKVSLNVDATKSGMGGFIRVGSAMTLPSGAEQLTWYGNGPVETYNDRKSGGRQGVWETSVSEEFFPYMKADDCGNLTDVKWISVKDPSSENCLLIAADGTVEASALHFTPSDLQYADHPYKLRPRSETYLNVDYGSLGVGSATCGQATLEKYRLPSSRTYSWGYTIMPASSSADGKELTDMAARLRSDGVTIEDKSSNQLSIPLGSSAKLKSTDSGNAVSGSVAIPDCEKLKSSFSGHNSFTAEVNVVPTGNPEFNMFIGDGDHGFALRTRNNSIDFFVRADGNWRSLYVEHTTTSGWIGSKHQVAGIYNAEDNTLSVYLDGKIIGTAKTNTTAGVEATAFPLTIGACPETGRASQADFYEARIYSKALTEAELASQNTASPAYSPDSPYVQLWVDFDNIAQAEPEEEEDWGDANLDGKVDLNDAVAILQYSALPGKYPLEPQGALNADVVDNGSSGVTGIDALAIQMYDAKLFTADKWPMTSETMNTLLK